MQKQTGSFLLQALLALTLIFAFMPFFASRLSSRDMAAQMYGVTEQIETAYNAARIYLREERDNLPYKKQELKEDDFADLLESYGLPFGFSPKTYFNQNISLIIDKNENGIYGYLNITPGKLSKIQMAELTRRIGFYAKINGNNIEVDIPLDSVYTDIVSKKETYENVGFLSELDINNNNIDKTDVLFARNGAFETGQFTTLALYGVEENQNKNKVSDLYATKTVFQSSDGGAALSLSRGEIITSDASLRTIAKFGATGGFESNVASVYDFSMSEDRIGFTGPEQWLVRGSVVADNFSFSVDRLDVGSYIDASRSQDVYIDPDSLSYATKKGIDVRNIYAANVSLRDQTSYGLLDGQSGSLLIDIRPAGTSLLPDAHVDTINNDSFEIIADPKAASSDTVSCRSIIESLGENYNAKSLAQNVICQYVFWQRLETRIDTKQCLQSGRDGCI